MRLFRKRDEAAIEQPLYPEQLSVTSPPDVVGLYFGADGRWHDYERERAEAVRVASLEAAARHQQEIREAPQTDGFQSGMPDFGGAGNLP